MAVVNKWITDDPFLEIHFKQTKTNRAFLTEEELNILLKKEFTIPRLQTVRDIFVFCALTGLAFTDVQHLRYEHIIKDVNGALSNNDTPSGSGSKASRSPIYAREALSSSPCGRSPTRSR